MKVEIIPFVGFNEIMLGQTLGQIQKLLGHPDELESHDYSDNSNERVLIYHNLGLELSFSSEDNYRLGKITFYSKDFTFSDIQIVGLNESEFILRLKSKYPDLTLDDDFSDLKSKDFSIDSLGVTVWLEEGVVESFTMYPKYLEDDSIEWPI